MRWPYSAFPFLRHSRLIERIFTHLNTEIYIKLNVFVLFFFSFVRNQYGVVRIVAGLR